MEHVMAYDHLIEDPRLLPDLSDDEIAAMIAEEDRRAAALDDQMDAHRDALREMEWG